MSTFLATDCTLPTSGLTTAFTIGVMTLRVIGDVSFPSSFPTPGAASSTVWPMFSHVSTVGPFPTDRTRVIASAIVDVPGYKGPIEIRAISSARTDVLGIGAPVHHATSPTSRSFTLTKSIAGSGPRRDYPFYHGNDAEMKVFEEIARNLPPDAKGFVYLTTMRYRVTPTGSYLEEIPACSGCTLAAFQMAAFRNVTIVSHAATHPPPVLDLFGHSADE